MSDIRDGTPRCRARPDCRSTGGPRCGRPPCRYVGRGEFPVKTTPNGGLPSEVLGGAVSLVLTSGGNTGRPSRTETGSCPRSSPPPPSSTRPTTRRGNAAGRLAVENWYGAYQEAADARVRLDSVTLSLVCWSARRCDADQVQRLTAGDGLACIRPVAPCPRNGEDSRWTRHWGTALLELRRSAGVLLACLTISHQPPLTSACPTRLRSSCTGRASLYLRSSDWRPMFCAPAPPVPVVRPLTLRTRARRA